jgi:uncharacterized protein DUF5648
MMKTLQIFLAKFALLASLLIACSFSSGCVIDYSTIQVGCLFSSSCSCFDLLGSGSSQCNQNIPVTALPPITGLSASFAAGFNIQTVFIDARKEIIWYIYDADQIYIQGWDIGNDTGMPTTGAMTQFGSSNPTDPNAVSTGTLISPVPGFIRFPDGQTPGTWTIEWVTSRYSFEFDVLNIPVVQGTSIGTDACNGQFLTDVVFPGRTVVMRCFIHNVGSSVQLAENLAPPSMSNVVIAGDGRDLTVTDQPMAQNVSAYQQGQVYVETYDVNGTNVGCFGYVVGCGADVTVNADGSLTLPAWALDWLDGDIPGFYTGNVFAIDPTTGNWVTSDGFGFQITNGGEPVYRFYIPCNGDHVFVLATDPVPYCGQLESNAAFYVYDTAAILGMTPNAVPFTRLLKPNGYMFYTDNPDEADYYRNYYGWWVLGIPLGYVLPFQTDNNIVPLYRLFDGDNRHFYTASWDEVLADVNWGWRYEGIQCWLPVGP